MSFGYDPEVPAGFQDADIEQAEFEAEGRRIAALHRRGICTHGATLGRKVPSVYSADDIAAMLRDRARFGNRGGFTGEQADIPESQVLCTDCGTLVDDPFAGRR